MKANDTMHSILSNLSEAIALIDSLTAEKSFTKDEWPRILKQDSSPSTAAAWQTRLCIFQSSRMEDNHSGEKETRLALNKKSPRLTPLQNTMKAYIIIISKLFLIQSNLGASGELWEQLLKVQKFIKSNFLNFFKLQSCFPLVIF